MLKEGWTKILVGEVVDQNDDGTLEITIPGDFPAPEGPDENPESTDGVRFISGAARGGYRAGDVIVILYFAEQLAPDEKFLVLGRLENAAPHADLTADRSVFASPDGSAVVIAENSESGGSPTLFVGKSSATKKCARDTDPTKVDSTTDAKVITWITLVTSAINTLAPGTITPAQTPSDITGKIDGGSAMVFVED